jgi:hypothetical protein
MSSQSKRGPRVIGRRHEIADKNIDHLRQRLADEPHAPESLRAHWRARIDKWLDYRLSGPNDERRL